MAGPTRRRFLGWVVGLLGVTAAGGGSWWLASRGDTAPDMTSAQAPEGTGTTSTRAAVGRDPAPPAPSPASTTPATAPTTVPPSTTMPPVSTAAPEMVSRAGWEGRPPQGEFVAHTIERMTVHHTGVYLEAPSEAPAAIRRHQRFHQDDKGWPDIAYHYVIDPAGRVFEGRPVWAKGDTATSYDPTGHFLVCCEADFNRQSPTQAQVDSLVYMLAWGAGEFGVDPGTIGGHRDYAATTCPGANLALMIDDGTIEALVRARL